MRNVFGILMHLLSGVATEILEDMKLKIDYLHTLKVIFKPLSIQYVKAN